MKHFDTLLIIAFVLMLSPHVYAQGSTAHSVQASQHVSQAGKHAVVGSVQVSAGVIAVPLAVAGSVGHVSMQSSQKLLQVNRGTFNISDETITVGPAPNKALATVE